MLLDTLLGTVVTPTSVLLTVTPQYGSPAEPTLANPDAGVYQASYQFERHGKHLLAWTAATASDNGEATMEVLVV